MEFVEDESGNRIRLVVANIIRGPSDEGVLDRPELGEGARAAPADACPFREIDSCGLALERPIM